MDTTVNTALMTLLGDFSESILDVVADILPIAGVILVTVGVTFFAINFFKKFMHH